jgi:hypothetical protein
MSLMAMISMALSLKEPLVTCALGAHAWFSLLWSANTAAPLTPVRTWNDHHNKHGVAGTTDSFTLLRALLVLTDRGI